ncbi:MAG: dihydrodipicolinate synthase family protein [Pseudomonadota bacterium]
MPGHMAMQIEGVWATMLCRIDIDGEIDLAAIDEQVEAYATAGCNGVYSGGTAAEIHSQSEVQFQEISTLFAAAARRHHLPFQIGATHPLATGSLGRAAFAATLAPDAIQVTLPDWTQLDTDGVHRFMIRVAEAAEGVPLVLYNPPHARTLLSPEQLDALIARMPDLVGLKCGGGDAAWYAAMAPVLKRISVFIQGHCYASGRAMGAHGSYSNMACLNPTTAVAWAAMAPDAALALEARIAHFMEEAIAPVLARGLPGFACDKAMAAAGFWTHITPRLLWPQTGAIDADVARIAEATHRHIPEFAEEALPLA